MARVQAGIHSLNTSICSSHQRNAWRSITSHASSAAGAHTHVAYAHGIGQKYLYLSCNASLTNANNSNINATAKNDEFTITASSKCEFANISYRRLYDDSDKTVGQ